MEVVSARGGRRAGGVLAQPALPRLTDA